ncbi:5'-3' exonuclease PLD3-like [Littorina saxatilis]|uniref:PLD phosphodiesterase domain-containing protein n=1 Tax=Littorina saxatilis TaxID=31220 RepID=A0AAN9BDL2_9CAEN
MKPKSSMGSSKQQPDRLSGDKAMLVSNTLDDSVSADNWIGTHRGARRAKRPLCFASFCFYFGIFAAGVFTALSVVAYYGMSTECYFTCAEPAPGTDSDRGNTHTAGDDDEGLGVNEMPMDFIAVAPPLAPSQYADNCVFTLVESIPQNLTFAEGQQVHPSTYSGLKSLIESAKESIHIASYYWTLRGSDIAFHDNSSADGEDIFRSLLDVGNHNLSLRIVQNAENNDTAILSQKGQGSGHTVEVRTVNFTRLLDKGILHTKFWLVDGKHFYIGSANLDWRSLTQVKELGVLVQNCSSLAANLQNIFDVYWYLGDPKNTIPDTWPSDFNTDINVTNPMDVRFNDTTAPVYLSSSPPEFCPEGRTKDLDAILDVIKNAKEFINIAVMDYSPSSLYLAHNRYWPVIDDALREAAFDRRVRVRILASKWNHTKKDMYPLLCSLTMMGHLHYPHTDLQVKLFEVPAFTTNQTKIPYARVNHNKYMVTDQHAYIGTSNWSEDYFGWTGGVGFIVNQNSTSTQGNFRQQLHDVFERDWNSTYIKDLICDFNHPR